MSHYDPHHAMLNWARWADSGDHHELEAKISSLWHWWLPHKAGSRDAGWGDVGQPEAIPDPIDTRAAEITDKALKRLPWEHYKTLRNWYYRHHRADSADLDEALRALGDQLERRLNRV